MLSLDTAGIAVFNNGVDGTDGNFETAITCPTSEDGCTISGVYSDETSIQLLFEGAQPAVGDRWNFTPPTTDLVVSEGGPPFIASSGEVIE